MKWCGLSCFRSSVDCLVSPPPPILPTPGKRLAWQLATILRLERFPDLVLKQLTLKPHLLVNLMFLGDIGKDEVYDVEE